MEKKAIKEAVRLAKQFLAQYNIPYTRTLKDFKKLNNIKQNSPIVDMLLQAQSNMYKPKVPFLDKSHGILVSKSSNPLQQAASQMMGIKLKPSLFFLHEAGHAKDFQKHKIHHGLMEVIRHLGTKAVTNTTLDIFQNKKLPFFKQLLLNIFKKLSKPVADYRLKLERAANKEALDYISKAYKSNPRLSDKYSKMYIKQMRKPYNTYKREYFNSMLANDKELLSNVRTIMSKKYPNITNEEVLMGANPMIKLLAPDVKLIPYSAVKEVYKKYPVLKKKHYEL